MQITSQAIGQVPYAVTTTNAQMPIAAPHVARAPGATSSESLDFSNITPRQLHAYLDEMTISERMDIDDGTTLFNAVPRGLYADRPDVPIDLTSRIKSILEFNLDSDSKPLSMFYAGLMDRMKLMEAQGLPISVVA
jgi:hypothetical protein